MTNDVRKIKKKIDADLEIDRTDKIRIALLKVINKKLLNCLRINWLQSWLGKAMRNI